MPAKLPLHLRANGHDPTDLPHPYPNTDSRCKYQREYAAKKRGGPRTVSPTNLGDVLRGYRQDQHMGLRELARIIGLDHNGLGKIEYGHTCSSATLNKILIWLLSSPTEPDT